MDGRTEWNSDNNKKKKKKEKAKWILVSKQQQQQQQKRDRIPRKKKEALWQILTAPSYTYTPSSFGHTQKTKENAWKLIFDSTFHSASVSLSLSLSLYLVKLAFGGFPYVLIRRDTGAITILFFVILQIRKEEINLKRKKKRKFQISPFPFSRSTHNTCLYNIQPIHTHTHFD